MGGKAPVRRKFPIVRDLYDTRSWIVCVRVAPMPLVVERAERHRDAADLAHHLARAEARLIGHRLRFRHGERSLPRDQVDIIG